MIVYLMNDLTILLVLWYQRFAKIIMAGTSPGNVITKFIGGNKLFYNAPLVKLSDLTINFFNLKIECNEKKIFYFNDYCFNAF